MSWDSWNKGVVLSQAHLVFCNREKVSRLTELEKSTSFIKVFDRIQENVDQGGQGFDILKNVVKKDEPAREVAGQLKNELKVAVLRWMENDQLFAYGFSLPRQASDIPQIVPHDLLLSYLASEGSSLKRNGLQMEAIRVVHANQVLHTATAIENAEKGIKAAGRPSRQGHIIEAFYILAEQEALDFSKTATSQYPKIAKWVMENYPDQENSETGLGSKAMAKYVNPLFKAAKKDFL